MERLWKENPCVCVCVSARHWTFDGVQELTLGLNWPYTDRYTKGTAVCSLADSFAFEIVQPHLNTYAAAANSHARPNAHWAAIWCAICSTTWSVAMVSDGGPSPPQGVGRSTDMRATRANAVMVVFHLTPHCGVNVKKKTASGNTSTCCRNIAGALEDTQTNHKQSANKAQTSRKQSGTHWEQSAGKVWAWRVHDVVKNAECRSIAGKHASKCTDSVRAKQRSATCAPREQYRHTAGTAPTRTLHRCGVCVWSELGERARVVGAPFGTEPKLRQARARGFRRRI